MACTDRGRGRSKLLGITRLFPGVLSLRAGAVLSCGAILGHCSALDPECCGNIRDKQLIRPGGSRVSVLERTGTVRGAWFWARGLWFPSPGYAVLQKTSLPRLIVFSESGVFGLFGSARRDRRRGSCVDRRVGRPAALRILRQLGRAPGAGSALEGLRAPGSGLRVLGAGLDRLRAWV